ncbi:uncharacterized protein [Linepithema humile]|uniref:uncharacterized protein n=1 Tax=Linepithema humile TaxID=83485 RepID=UPI00351ED695
MEATIKNQMSNAGYIERFWENLIKVGKEKMSSAYLKTRLELLETYWTRFLNQHDKILSFDQAETTNYMTVDVFTIVEESYIDVKSRITEILSRTNNLEHSVEDSFNSSSGIKLQLLRINLPSFDGDQLAREGFRDLFKSLVHDVEGLSPTQKLQYLKTSLKGEAASIIANLPMSSDGYALAWDELVFCYDNRRVLIAIHMHKLLSCSPVSKASAIEINELLSVVNAAMNAFFSRIKSSCRVLG